MSTTVPFPTPLDALEHWEGKTPASVYLTQPLPDGNVIDYTWAQVADEARRGAAYITSLGLPPRSCVALIGRNSAHWIIADLAIWMAGHVTVPLYPTLNADTARYILEHSDARLVVLGRLDGKSDNWNALRDTIPSSVPTLGLPMAPPEAQVRWEDIVRTTPPLREMDRRTPDDLLTIIYTSGTTGHPKGVMHSSRSLCAPSATARDIWKMTSQDRMLSYLPLAHVAERVAVEIPSLMLGFRVYFSEGLETFAADLKRARPTWFFSVPRLWTKFYQAVQAKIPPERQRELFADPVAGPATRRRILEELGLDQARLAFTAAAPLSADIIEWYRELGLELLEVFGMTENAATSHASRPGDHRPGYVGTPLPDVECRLSEAGEILVRSPGQMLGYYRMPDVTAESFTADGYFRTGDRGELDANGRLRVTGRVKDSFKTSKGKYVTPVPIENRLAAYPGIEVACVTGPGQPEPFALAILAPTTRGDDAEIRVRIERELEPLLDEINGVLDDHERLGYLVVVSDAWTTENGFLTPTLKLKRGVIEDRYLARAEGWRADRRKVIWA